MSMPPTTTADLKSMVAHHSFYNRRIRAVGSEKSFSNVNTTDGVLIHTHKLRDRLPLTSVRSGWDAASLVRVGCGRTVRDLQRELAAEGRMLENTPAFTGQTLAGAVSTASHGTGRGFGPICDEVVSVDLVLDGGRLLRVEAVHGPTDAQTYSGDLVQHDDWFHSVLVGLGAFGVHASYILRTVPLIHLVERRYLVPLEQALCALSSAPARHVGILFSPYADAAGVRWACVTERTVGDAPSFLERQMPRQRLWPMLFSRLPIDKPVLQACSAVPKIGVTWMLNRALGATCRERFVADAPTVLDNYPLNQCAGAHAFEASLPHQDLSQGVALFLKRAALEAESGRWLTGPVSVRTVAASSQFLAPTHGRDSVVFEGISLHASPWAREVLRPFAEDLDGLGGRPHFGLDVFTVASAQDLNRLFPAFSRWQSVLQEIDPRGRFDNPLMDRLAVRRSLRVAA